MTFKLSCYYAAHWTPSDDFINYIIDQEGFSATPYDSFEDRDSTTKTHTIADGHLMKKGETVESLKKKLQDIEVGYGHQLAAGENPHALTKDEAKALLKLDLRRAYAKACRDLGFAPTGYLAEMATEYAYNGCPKEKFPKLWKDGFIPGNAEVIKNEFHRFSRGASMHRRDELCKSRFIDPTNVLHDICHNGGRPTDPPTMLASNMER